MSSADRSPTESANAPDRVEFAGWNLQHSYARLPACMFQQVGPEPVKQPEVVLVNDRLADELGMDFHGIESSQLAAWFSGNDLPPGASPIAQAYAGHQYGHFTMLGDGRAVLLGEQVGPMQQVWDVQLKGSGPTAFSRRGDGRAALGPMLREYIISEAMEALGIPTTRSLAVVATGEPVYRETILPGAILVRVASSHIRVGTFEYAVRRDVDALTQLAEYTIQRHFPSIPAGDDRFLRLLQAVLQQQTALVAAWMHVGFLHGVLNTDNVSIAGETIDYGPCAFMNAYDPATVFSSIDHGGRYAFGNQPAIMQWNLMRFAETLLPLIADGADEAVKQAGEVLETFPAQVQQAWKAGMQAKLGLPVLDVADEPSQALIDDLLQWMQANDADYTNTFRDLSEPHGLTDAVYQDASFQAWHARWRGVVGEAPKAIAEAQQRMREVNPAVIPRNHLVEQALSAATLHGDLQPLLGLLAVLNRPFETPVNTKAYCDAPPDGDQGYRTFCGT